MKNTDADDSKTSSPGDDSKAKQKVEKIYYAPHSISTHDMSVDTKRIYRNWGEAKRAADEGTLQPGMTTCIKNGRMYFLCPK